ncbi:MAG TPA: RNA polymerase sigma factor [Bacteroidetes bacterium]|nr:RNA polymerase sigma factor [Bacteroidota bacterium]
MNNPDELKLIQDFNNGNEQAYNQLVLRYKEKVYWIVRRMIPDHDDADDITQNVFIKAYQSLHSFKGDSSFYTWIYRIAINLSLNEIRRKKVRKIFSIDEEIHQISTSDDQPIQLLINEEQTQRIKKAIERLPEKQKKVFLLRYYEELPYEEIAHILHTSVGGLKANYFHAVKKIGEYLKNERE